MSGNSEIKPKRKSFEDLVGIARRILVDQSRPSTYRWEPTLEEAELEDDENVWRMTFGYFLPSPKPEQYPVMLGKGPEQLLNLVRRYKVIRIKADTGEVISVKAAGAGKSEAEPHL